MSRLHCALNTNRFKASVDFYAKLFGRHPTKLEDGYTKSSCDDPYVNLTLNKVSIPIHQDAINHLGIEVEDARAVMVAKDRLEQLGLATKLEEDVDCCYAILNNSDMKGASLYQADLSGAQLKGADLSDSNMTEAILSAANLHSANLRYCNLSNTV